MPHLACGGRPTSQRSDGGKICSGVVCQGFRRSRTEVPIELDGSVPDLADLFAENEC